MNTHNNVLCKNKNKHPRIITKYSFLTSLLIIIIAKYKVKRQLCKCRLSSYVGVKFSKTASLLIKHAVCGSLFVSVG